MAIVIFFFFRFSITAKEALTENDLCNIEPGDMVGNVIEDKKHCYFHWELNNEQNLSLKQR